jgi:hypothetical protein
MPGAGRSTTAGSGGARAGHGHFGAIGRQRGHRAIQQALARQHGQRLVAAKARGAAACQHYTQYSRCLCHAC